MKKFLSMVLSLCMILSLFSGLTFSANAASPSYTEASSSYKSSVYYTNLMNVELTGDQAQDIVNIARSQVGYHEGNSMSEIQGGNSSGTGDYTEYGHWYESTGAWCATFILWCARRANIDRTIIKDPYGAAYGTLSDPGANFAVDFIYRDDAASQGHPKIGDIIYFDWNDNGYGDHVGLVSYVNSSKTQIKVIHGNYSNEVQEGTLDITKSTHDKPEVIDYDTIFGYGVPNYTNSNGSSTNVAVTGVSLNRSSGAVNVGSTLTLTATVSPSNATNKNVTWSSSDTSVATVSNGVVTAKAKGTATITVKTADGSKTATCTITVNNTSGATPSTKTQYRYGRWVPKGYESSWWHFCPELGEYYAEIENRAWKGQPWVLNYYNQSVNDGWSDTQLYTAKISQSGYCDDSSHDHTINNKTYYTIKNGNYYWDKYTVGGTTYYWEETRTVCVVHNYTNDCDTVCNVCGETRTFNGHKYDNNCDTSCNICGKTRTITHTWTNDCDTSCNICGATRTITHTWTDSTDDTCNVCGQTRNIAVSGVSLNKTSTTLDIGKTVTLTATVSPSTATNKNVTWSSSNTSVATVSNGVVTAKAKGTATITVKTADGSKTATCTVTVNNPIIASGECGKDGDNVIWTLNNSGLLTLTGEGEMADYTNSMYAPWYSYTSNIRRVVFEGNITSIGVSAFCGLRELMLVSIPSSVTKIGSYAFMSTAISEIVLGENVVSIGQNAFDNCKNLSDVTLHDNISKIGSYAFSECDSLEEIDLPSSLTKISSFTFYGCDILKTVNIPESVTTIEEGAFRFCTGLVEIKLPSKVTQISNQVFGDCKSLEKVDYSDITSIGSYAFARCTALTSINLPSTIKTIDFEAFGGCSGLTDVYYEGSEIDRTTISINSTNNYIKNATWHYGKSEETPDEDAPQIVIDSVKGRLGETVTVNVSLKNNPGIWGMDLVVNYDKSQLTLTNVTNGTVFSSAEWTQGNLTGEKYILSYEASGFENIFTNGTVAILEFKINENATIDTISNISVSYNSGDIINVNFDDIELGIVPGSVNIVSFVYGDLNGDTLVNKKDSLLMKMYLANNSTVIDLQAADVYFDGSVNKKDSLYLKQYLAGLGVKLGK